MYEQIFGSQFYGVIEGRRNLISVICKNIIVTFDNGIFGKGIVQWKRIITVISNGKFVRGIG